MPQTMQDIKRRIRSVTGTEHITNAMKLVSAAKLRRAKATFEKTNAYFHFISEAIHSVFMNKEGEIPPEYLLGNREIKTTCYIIVTSSRGLCGSFNSNVIKNAEADLRADPEPPVLVTVGSRGRDYFAKRGYHIISEYVDPPESISFLETRKMSKPIVDMYNRGEIDEVVLIYNAYINTLEQKVRNVTLLPFDMADRPEGLEESKIVEYEPSVEEVFNYLVPKYVELMIYDAVVESATCEHAARRIAMENATDNAREMLTNLNLYYNRARQSAITNEIIEIVSGSEAQK